MIVSELMAEREVVMFQASVQILSETGGNHEIDRCRPVRVKSLAYAVIGRVPPAYLYHHRLCSRVLEGN